MALRFSCKNAVVALAGTTFVHSCTLTPGGTASTPDEWKFNHRGAPPAGSPPMYLVSIGTTNMVVAAASGATTGDIFASLNHSIIG